MTAAALCTKGWADRCADATGSRCTCECGGANHGKNHPNSLARRVRVQPNLLNGDGTMEMTPWETFEPRNGIRREFKAGAQEGGEFVLNRSQGDAEVYLDDGGGAVLMGQPLVYHSPTGYEWGYYGSGPADLALNILERFVEPPEAWRLHQAFKAEVVATVPQDGGAISAEFVREWLLERWAGEEGGGHGRG